MANVRSTGGFVSDQDLTEKEFLAKYMPDGVFTERYLKAMYRWLLSRKGDDYQQLVHEMHEAYRETDAYQIYTAKNVKSTEV
jgi:hypothetical protein